MERKKAIATIIMISLSVVAVIIGIVNATQAAYTNSEISVNNESYTTGLLSVTASSKSDTLVLENALPISDEEGALGEPYELTIKNIGNVSYEFDLQLMSENTEDDVIDSHYIKVKCNDDVVKTLYDCNGIINSDKFVIAPSEIITIEVRIWLSKENPSTPNSQIGRTFNGKIVVNGKAVDNTTNSDNENSAINYITNLYNDATKTPKIQTGSNMTYNYAELYNDEVYSGGLMNDRLGSMETNIDSGNIRYYGVNPKNYIYFNCEDYSDTTTCEVWRIIGIVDGRLKIIRNTSIGNYSWDSSPSNINSGYGINQWGESNGYTGSDLMKLLNPGYDDNTIDGTNTLVNNSLYWERTNGKCFNGSNNFYENCDFASSGITTATKDNNLIADATWYLGGINNNQIYANEAYTSERGTNVVVPGTTCSGTYCNDTVTRTISWTGKGGLMYLSDYAYAADLTKCGMLSDYNSSNNSYECRKNDWLYFSHWQWTINAPLASASNVWYVNGGAYYDSARYSGAVRPVYYLNSDAIIGSGDGSQNNPYQILVG